MAGDSDSQVLQIREESRQAFPPTGDLSIVDSQQSEAGLSRDCGEELTAFVITAGALQAETLQLHSGVLN